MMFNVVTNERTRVSSLSLSLWLYVRSTSGRTRTLACLVRSYSCRVFTSCFRDATTAFITSRRTTRTSASRPAGSTSHLRWSDSGRVWSCWSLLLRVQSLARTTWLGHRNWTEFQHLLITIVIVTSRLMSQIRVCFFRGNSSFVRTYVHCFWKKWTAGCALFLFNFTYVPKFWTELHAFFTQWHYLIAVTGRRLLVTYQKHYVVVEICWQAGFTQNIKTWPLHFNLDIPIEK